MTTAAVKARSCPVCNHPVHGRSDKRYCSDVCRARQAVRDAIATSCCIPGCAAHVRSRSATVCSKHYFRIRRGGTPDLRRNPTRRQTTKAGYVLVHQPDHPLARGNGWVFEHRVVLHRAIGPGCHPCTWCNRPVTWGEQWPVSVDALVSDHLNGDVSDNRPTNLVPSCGPCNWARGT